MVLSLLEDAAEAARARGATNGISCADLAAAVLQERVVREGVSWRVAHGFPLKCLGWELSGLRYSQGCCLSVPSEMLGAVFRPNNRVAFEVPKVSATVCGLLPGHNQVSEGFLSVRRFQSLWGVSHVIAVFRGVMGNRETFFGRLYSVRGL